MSAAVNRVRRWCLLGTFSYIGGTVAKLSRYCDSKADSKGSTSSTNVIDNYKVYLELSSQPEYFPGSGLELAQCRQQRLNVQSV